MRLLPLLMVAVLAAVVLPGCSDNPAPAAAPHDAVLCVNDQLQPCSLNATAPKVDARKTLDDLKAFSSAYPYRSTGSPTMAGARDDLEGRFKAAGLRTARQDFDSGGQNIIGIKMGTDPTQFIVVGGHYDVTEGAVYGTYDDGSGTADVFALAAAYANVNTTRGILFCEFDQEEKGLVGSTAFVKGLDDGSTAKTLGLDNFTVDGMIDIDMFGITWPHPASIIVLQNSPSLKEKITNLTAAVGVPADHLEFRKSRGGSSDGVSFIRGGIATAYFWSDWDQFFLPAGVEQPYVSGYAGSYPWWHKMDTYDTMVASAGSEDVLQQGWQNALDIVSPLLLHMTTPAFQPDPESA